MLGESGCCEENSVIVMVSVVDVLAHTVSLEAVCCYWFNKLWRSGIHEEIRRKMNEWTVRTFVDQYLGESLHLCGFKQVLTDIL